MLRHRRTRPEKAKNIPTVLLALPAPLNAFELLFNWGEISVVLFHRGLPCEIWSLFNRGKSCRINLEIPDLTFLLNYGRDPINWINEQPLT